MNDPMRIIKFDHRDVKELLTKLSDTEEGEERDALVEEVTTKLTAHMVMEESLIYPLIAEQVGEEDEEEAEIEHGLAREGLEKLNSMKDQPGFGAVVEMLKAGVEHHVQEEEKELLPELKDQLSREEWSALGDRIVEEKERAGLPLPQATSQRRSTKRSSTSRSKSSKSSTSSKSSSGSK